MENQLIKVVELNGLEKSKSETIVNHFQSFLVKANSLEQEARLIIVKDASDVEEMKKARETRLELQKIRVNAEKTRKQLKEQSLREGKAIDGMANIIKAVIVPLEEYLQSMEDFVEIQENKRKDEQEQNRKELIQPYMNAEEEVTNLYNLREMSEDGFNQLLKAHKEAYEAAKVAEAKAEKERLAREAAEMKERQRIVKENEKLKKEAMKRESLLQEERRKAEEIERKAREVEELRVTKEAKAKAIRKEEEFKKWLANNGWTSNKAKDFYIAYEGSKVCLYRLIATYNK